jgi:Ran GTPase-activating protein (RanGAP) involved in mRNA processing and transport
MSTVLRYAVLEKKCKGLNLWGNQFNSESILILANVLNGNKTLRELDLSYNHLKDDGVRIICEVLASNTCAIKEIDLSSNQITDEGVKYIAKMLTKNDKLKYLILNNNEITNDGLLLLADALTNNKNKKLQELKLESNILITRTGVETTLGLLQDNKIFEELYVKDCGIFDEDWEILENMAFKTGFDVMVRNKWSKDDSS